MNNVIKIDFGGKDRLKQKSEKAEKLKNIKTALNNIYNLMVETRKFQKPEQIEEEHKLPIGFKKDLRKILKNNEIETEQRNETITSK